jgi:hypothetical protein
LEEEFYAVVKLKNGEEFFSQVCPSEEDDKEVLLLYYPVTISPVRFKEGFNFIVHPWIKIGNESLFVINREDILTMSEIYDDNLIDMHNNFIASREQRIPHQEKLNSSMGLIGTVSKAKETLERIFNNS